jgi:gliding motility-associated-like protein
VIVPSNSTLTLNTTSTQTGCILNNGTATASASNGTPPYTYNWNNGETNSVATGLSAGLYLVTVTDANGCTRTQTISVTQIAGPTVNATANPSIIPPGGNTTLTATGGGTYLWTPSTGLSCTTCSDPTATPSQNTDYCVLVTDTNGCKDSACITVNVEIPCETLFIPGAFSPNDDGENEIFCLMGNNCIQKLYFAIYDRWGEKIFETSDSAVCWDGKYRGRLLNTAVFVYFLKAGFTNGEEIIKKGNISLIR